MLIKKESALILMSSQLWRTTYRALKRYGFVEVIYGARTNKVHGLYLPKRDTNIHVLEMVTPLSEVDTSARTKYVALDADVQPNNLDELITWVETKISKSTPQFMEQELSQLELTRPFTDLEDLVLHVDLNPDQQVD